MKGWGGRKKKGEGRGSRVRVENKRGEGRLRNKRRGEMEGGWGDSRGMQGKEAVRRGRTEDGGGGMSLQIQ